VGHARDLDGEDGRRLMNGRLTVLITARNAEATIERAVRSALAQGGEVLLVDDHSSDATAARAHAAGGDRLRIVSPAEHETIGHARQTGIEAVTTPFMMWVDADDEAQPGRAARLLARLEREGADLVFDAADLHDGHTNAFLRHLPIPDYLRRDPTGVRQFERNVLPSLGWPLMRTSWAQRIGYDRTCHGVEDYDFFLRSCLEGARVGYETVPGYHQYAYPTSISRALADRRAGVKALLAKHGYPMIRARYAAAGHGYAITAWALVAVAVYREDYDSAAHFVEEAAATVANPAHVLELDGPCAEPEGWRVAFYRGTLALLADHAPLARRELARAHAISPSAETANNLGVALARVGARTQARRLFESAAKLFPSYLDARLNLDSPQPNRITTHPLRRSAARSEYPVAIGA
jgi:glycosyltransferase involved in cell wall biosynthesis